MRIDGEYKKKILEEIEKFDSFEIDDNSLIMYQKISESDLITKAVLYKTRYDQITRIEITADLTKELVFFIKSNVYVKDSKTNKIIEIENGLIQLIYKRDKKLLNKYLVSKNIFELFNSIEKRQDLLIKESKEGLFRVRQNNGYDLVYDEYAKKTTIPSDTPTMDEIKKK